MVNQIADICNARSLHFSVWIDDWIISDNFVQGIVLSEIRNVIRYAGLKSHRIKYWHGNKPVFVTKFSIVGKNLLLTQVGYRKSVSE